jgi:hypothetical protein
MAATTTSPSHHHHHHHNSSGMATSQRKSSGPLALDGALPPLPSALADTLPSVPSSWRTNPHSSSPNNKTSQYIERITAENERLARELKAERLLREEEGKRVGAARAKAEDNRAETQRLQVLADTNARALERKDRKIEELSAALATERTRREAAEQREAETIRLLSEERDEAKQQLALAKEMQMQSETQAKVAKEGFKRVNDGYKTRIQFVNQELAKLMEERRNQADQIRRQIVINDQMKVELSNIQRADRGMADTLEQYKAEHEAEVEELTREARQLRIAVPQREAQAAALVTDMEETRDRMKWVMAQKKYQDDKK